MKCKIPFRMSKKQQSRTLQKIRLCVRMSLFHLLGWKYDILKMITISCFCLQKHEGKIEIG